MTESHEVPPQAQLLQALFGLMVAKCLSAVAAYDVAGALKDGPLYYTDLAAKTGTDQRSLHRVMRMLSGAGLFDEVAPGTYALTPVSELLRKDVPGSMRDLAVMITSESHWQPWGRMESVLATGKSGAQHAFGTDFFTWCQRDENREQWALFNAAMTSFSSSVSAAVAETYDFRPFHHIVDIGGGHGYFLKTILDAAPSARGTLFDLPAVVGGADSAELGPRITREGGDFFQAVTSGGDCYTLKHIIHDWGDDASRTILANIKDAMDPAGRVLVVETVMPESPVAHPAKFMDVNMLAMTEGGCERTRAEYAELFASAGLRLIDVHATPSPLSVIEAARG